MELQTRRERNKCSQYPHELHVRISIRQFNDIESIKKARGTTDTYIVREALQQYLNQEMYNIINPGKAK